jgi:ABC-type Fe3+/spermidine/putrescine transport system ATPase subunit|tara:strand:- start:2664 stop:3629 length:966 start_codon:yes stop_codon:yes gene_type:complete
MNLLEIKNLSLSYDSTPVINNISFKIKKGEITCILGESGCGKTSILKAIRGFMNRDSGEIYFQNERVFNKSEKLVPGTNGVAIVHQDFQLEPGFTVFENIRHHLIKYSREFQEARTIELIDVCNLGAIQNKKSKELSGGQKQKVALAKALIEEPPLLILDEPFSNLDNISKFEFKDILKKVVKQLNISLLFVTHDSKDALTFSDDIIILQNGKIIQEGKPKEIATKPTNEYAAKLIGLTNIISGKEISPFATFDVNKNKNYWVPFNCISVIETGALKPVKIDFLGDETIAHVKLNNVLIQVKSFNNFPVTFGIEISNAIML